MTVNASRITKIAGVTLAGFVVASVAADKVNLGPVASQVAGVVGAFLGTLGAGLRSKQEPSNDSPPGDSKETFPQS